MRAGRAWPVALSTFVYLAIMLAARWLVHGFDPQIGGFLVGLVEVFCISSYLFLIGKAVAASRITLEDLKLSFIALFRDVIGVLFALWIAGLVIGLVSRAAGDHGPFVLAAWGLAVSVLLNPIPEHIHQGRSNGSTIELLLESVRFVQHHWIEWFVPNLLLGLALLVLVEGRSAFEVETLTETLPHLFSLQGAYMLGGILITETGELWKLPLIIALVYLTMVFRGLLFRELVTGNWRARAFRARTR